MGFLTDRSLATGVTLQDLIHIVITGDTSQGNFAGSSYKATIQQVSDALLPVFTGTSIYEVGSGTDSTQRIGVGADASGDYSLVGGGTGNTASGNYSFVGGGSGNTANFILSNVVGGVGNTASCYHASVLSGIYNRSIGFGSTVSGGYKNTSKQYFSFIGGGEENIIYDNLRCNSSIVGGASNFIDNGNLSFIGGGSKNTILIDQSFIGGGSGNTVSCQYSFIGGGIENNALGLCSIIGGGYQNKTTGLLTTIGGGGTNSAYYCYSTVSGGICNSTIGDSSVIGGGKNNTIINNDSTISGGYKNTVYGSQSFIGGGVQNSTISTLSTIVGGVENKTNCNYSSILGGSGNTVSHCFSSAVGCGVTSVSACTFHTNYLALQNTPETDIQTVTQYLTRDSSTGVVKTKIIPGPTVYGLFAQTGNSAVISATTVESTLIDSGVGSLSVPANGFSIGDSFRADFGGIMSVKPGGDTLRIRVKSGSVVLGDTGVLSVPSVTNDVWLLNINFTIRKIGGPTVASIVTLGNLHVIKAASTTPTSFAFNTVNATTFDTINPNTLDVTAQWGTNNAANAIYSDIFVLNKIY